MFLRAPFTLFLLTMLLAGGCVPRDRPPVGPEPPSGADLLTTAVMPLADNPVIEGNNIFAQELLRVDDRWWCFYGGWQEPGQTNDKVYLVRSASGDLRGPWSVPEVMLENGEAQMLNDPTIVRDEAGVWHMLYTLGNVVPEPPPLFDEWIGYSSSRDGIHWTPSEGQYASKITIDDPANIVGGALTGAARPSLLRDASGWRLYFDGDRDRSGSPDSFVAVSEETIPNRFRIVHRFPRENGFPGFWEPDVAPLPGGGYIAVFQRYFRQVYGARSADGINFTSTVLIESSSPDFGRASVSNPALVYDEGTDQLYGIGFGMTDSPLLLDHDIGFALVEAVSN